MIKINISKVRLDEICKEYTTFITGKIKEMNGNSVYSYFKANLKSDENIISSDCDNLQKYILDFTCKFNREIDEHVNGYKTKDYVKNEFTCFYEHMKAEYKRLFGNAIKLKTPLGTWLAGELNINVCPYCNRQYTFTVKKNNGENGVRPQFDHFHPKSKYPYLALSFYNLIPSCPTCNHAKSETEISINPYVSGFECDCKFSIDKVDKCILNGQKGDWNIGLPDNGNHASHVKAFAIRGLYNQHKDYVEEMVTKAQSYNKGYYESLKTSFRGLCLSEREMNLLIFGNYISTNDFDKRPLSKLTADILEQLEVEQLEVKL